MATIFISYSNADSRFAHVLGEDLQRSGHGVQYGQAVDGGPHASFWLAIESDVHVAILSPAYVTSPSAVQELEGLVQSREQRGTVLIPLLLGKVELPQDLWDLQLIDFTGSYQIALQRLLDVLALIDATRPATDPAQRTAQEASPSPAAIPAGAAPAQASEGTQSDIDSDDQDYARRGRAVRALRRAMDRLDPEDRFIVQLHFQEGYPLNQIALLLKVDQKPLYRRVEKLRQQVRAYLEEDGIRVEDERGLSTLLREPEHESPADVHAADPVAPSDAGDAASVEGSMPESNKTYTVHIPTIRPITVQREDFQAAAGLTNAEHMPSPPGPSAFSVTPASISDQPAAQDALGFEPYVRAVAEFLTNEGTRPPLTLSIEGEWGTGKSSFMTQLQRAIQERQAEKGRQAAVTIWFNPWRHDHEEALWAAFALEFLRAVSGQLPFIERWRGHLRLLWRRFSWRDGWLDVVRAVTAATASVAAIGILVYVLLADGGARLVAFRDAIAGEDADTALLTLLLGLGGGSVALAVAVTLWKQAKSFIGDPLRFDLKRYVHSPDYQSRISFIEHFHEDFGRIVKAYVGERKVFVFIDDLDRCQTPKAADLMQALNLMIGAGEQPIVFILGMDRAKIAASIAVKFKDLLPYMTADPARSGTIEDSEAARRGLEYGSEFIEKFVQLSFRIPQPGDPDVAALLRSISGDGKPLAAPSPGPAAPATGFGTVAGGPVPPTHVLGISTDPGRPSPSRDTAHSGPPPEEPVRAALQQEVAVDSERLHDIVRMVAPALDYNPRRLKQFVNVFRLRAYLAIATGLVGDFTGPRGLTFEKLGKFVAVGLRWPLLLADLEARRDLLERLEAHALGVEGDTAGVVAFWTRRTRLMELLTEGLVDEEGEILRDRWLEYGMTGLNVGALLQIAAPPSVRYGPGGTNIPRDGTAAVA
jgi:RNA polymerase sigma factor (sigma-70 family)